MKNHSLKTVIINHIAIDYFYTKEKKDVNGNPRYRVYIIDPEAPAVYEKIFKCYESEISERVHTFIEDAQQ
jgi:hypothetical protein